MDFYSPTSHYRDGCQSQYDAGLSYFPDTPMLAPMPLGSVDAGSAVGGVVGTAIGGPVGAPIGAIIGDAANSIFSNIFGGSTRDRQRQDRVNWIANQAAGGNVAAAQLILAGPTYVSGNEKPMWTSAASELDQLVPQVMAQARAAGPVWFVNSGDTVTDYPRIKAFVAAWASQHPLSSLVGQMTGASGAFPATPVPGTSVVPGATVATVAPSSHLSPWLLGAGALAVGFLMTRRRRG